MKRLLAFVRAHERRISTAVFLGGFIIDSLTLTRVDFAWVHGLFTMYLVIAAMTLILMHHFSGTKPDSAATRKLPINTVLPMVTQFVLGGLLSGCLVFYTKSATLYASWPFLLLLAVVFIGNEVLHKYRERILFQSSLFFFALYSYAMFALPIAVGSISTLVFLGSGVVSVGVFAALLFLMHYIRKDGFETFARQTGIAVGSILLVVNLFYFTGILPPLPLALKDAGVYHSLVRTPEGYEVTAEPRMSWFSRISRQTLHLAPGETPYAFSAVFAPVALETPIVHRWEFYDEAKGEWVTKATLPFFIRGGRDAGYRGYSFMREWEAGEWRVSIETESGATIGYIRFDIETVPQIPNLETVLK